VADERARDIVDQLAPRDVCGGRLTERIGRRAWERPRVSVSPRIYRLYRIPDPWDPHAPTSDASVGLGPVALRLGEQKRQPAPHLQPKPPKSKPKGLAGRARDTARDAGVATKKAAKSASPNTPPSAPSDAVKPAGRVEPTEEGRLAELAAERRRQAELARPRPRRAPAPEEPSPSSGERGLRAPLPVRPDLDVAEPVDDGGVSPQQATVRSQAGRFRMKPVQAMAAPTVRTVDTEESEVSIAPEVTRPPERVSLPTPGGGGLDDLFGAAMRQGRLSMSNRTGNDEEDEDEG